MEHIPCFLTSDTTEDGHHTVTAAPPFPDKSLGEQRLGIRPTLNLTGLQKTSRCLHPPPEPELFYRHQWEKPTTLSKISLLSQITEKQISHKSIFLAIYSEVGKFSPARQSHTISTKVAHFPAKPSPRIDPVEKYSFDLFVKSFLYIFI